MDDAVIQDFFAYGLGAGIPPNTGYFLAELCQRRGGALGTRLPDTVGFAKLIGIYDFETGKVKADDLAAIIAFLQGHEFVTVESDGSLLLTERSVTWWSQYNRSISREGLHDMLIGVGLGRVADVIEKQALPSIRLSAYSVEDEDALPIGASKIGGSPDLPLDFDWPRQGDFPLAFIAQIDLTEVAPYDGMHLLPPSGLLSFFLDYAHLYAMWPHPPDISRMYYHDCDRTSLRRTPMPEPLPERPDDGPYRPCSLSCTMEWTLPDYLPYYYSSWHSGIRELLGPIIEPFTEEEREAFSEVERRLHGPAYTINRMLGHPDPIQGFDLYPDKVLLMQIDSEDDADMMWGDVGRLYWWMTKDELARRDFSNVRFDEQCS